MIPKLLGIHYDEPQLHAQLPTFLTIFKLMQEHPAEEQTIKPAAQETRP